ncbi:hypothetical protein DC366_13570 [Pelagivirga sediminicola]|uniref:Uncharacterized protein n=1 Tax=Pelagivirga sediminicola TaxID=2170575 RepID=A0A2T7G4S4_9RHOB|nr:hypothetical protein [Pelagivirga sediminicola]PVA09415.1 hypothetical protein DC366_13570 [Pelagivirga sediminicola]
MAAFYGKDYQNGYRAAVDPVTARLRTEQLRRALRVAATLGGGDASHRVSGLSGQILDDGDSGGEGARVIDPEGEDPRTR